MSIVLVNLFLQLLSNLRFGMQTLSKKCDCLRLEGVKPNLDNNELFHSKEIFSSIYSQVNNYYLNLRFISYIYIIGMYYVMWSGYWYWYTNVEYFKSKISTCKISTRQNTRKIPFVVFFVVWYGSMLYPWQNCAKLSAVARIRYHHTLSRTK